MTTPKGEDPAFPFACQGQTTAPEIYYGMTLRDWFAGMALQGWAAGRNNGDSFNASSSSDPTYVAASCYAYADAMIKEKYKPYEPTNPTQR